MNRRFLWSLAIALVLASLTVPSVLADDAWLDASEPDNWNQVGAAVPLAPTGGLPLDPRVEARLRGPETDADRALVAAGWKLYASYEAGWGVSVILGAAGFDGMGRPNDYQAFVFAKGFLVGTLSPTLMQSREDGALSRVMLTGPDQIYATYLRYTDADARCCPSGISNVTFRLERRGPVVLVVPASATTSSTGARAPTVLAATEREDQGN